MNIIIVGFGFIGKETVRALYNKIDTIKRLDEEFRIVGISDSKGYVYDEKGLNLEKFINIERLSDYTAYNEGGSAEELIEERDVDLMVEATPTNIENGEPGLTFIRKALKRGIHVVTSIRDRS